MARFRAVVQGNKGETSRLGGEKSGIITVAAGHHTAVEVRAATYTDDNGEIRDQFEIVVKNVQSAAGACVLDITERSDDRVICTYYGFETNRSDHIMKFNGGFIGDAELWKI